MCGIVGFFDGDAASEGSALAARAQRMAETLTHRGPDDQGVWTDPRVGLALGHRRLSIVDLSPEGHQPMVSADERWVITYNGEIYNYLELRDELAARRYPFRGHSDTEVMLAAFQEWGVERAVERFNGMFAFAAWNRSERLLYLVRDRLGEKPLYYGWQGQTFLFGSELKALRAHPAFRAAISPNVLALYLRHNYVPAPHSIYQGIYKLPPASVLVLHPGSRGDEAPRAYWKMAEVLAASEHQVLDVSDEEAIERLDAELRDAVRLRMHADVPVGAFLSGGVDSSTVVALMQQQSSRPVETFTIGSTVEAKDEAVPAAAVARHLGTSHSELYVTPEEARDVIPLLPRLYDEPFADSSEIPTFLVSRLARTKVTVSLSGDGGDEIFAGYERYANVESTWKLVERLPSAGRRWAGDVLRGILERVGGGPGVARNRVIGRVARIAELLSLKSSADCYTSAVSGWKHPTAVVLGSEEPRGSLGLAQEIDTERSFLERMQAWDMLSYLPDDILVKLDRASMGVSLESRIPLLDHRLIELAWRLPERFKVRGRTTKWILRQVLYRYVPPALIERPKRGFGIPVSAWIRGPLREWAEDLLSEGSLKRQGFFNARWIVEAFRQHTVGSHELDTELWTILMFQAWLAEQRAT
jgi:asparagine synthase (glutamine-hydrolysing)